MDVATVDGLLGDLLGEPFQREPVRSWALSGVERLRRHGGGTVIFKWARTPLTGEADVLTHAASHGVPVPRVLAATSQPGLLGMLLDDLGAARRDPLLAEAAAAAVATHQTPPPSGLGTLDAVGLAELPQIALLSLTDLQNDGRWSGTGDIGDRLERLAKLAPERAQDAETPPFGLCHSEFHPTSLHIGADDRWRLLDWARAFTGPGLLDLISWQGTTTPPDPAAFDDLAGAYLAAGGPATTTAHRGGLPAHAWAVGWHRVWAVEWYLAQALTWISDPARDEVYQRVIRRHLDEALTCLDPQTT